MQHENREFKAPINTTPMMIKELNQERVDELGEETGQSA